MTSDGRYIVHDGKPPWCYINKKAPIGACADDLQNCNRIREDKDTPCEEWRAAGCFYARSKLTGDPVRLCMPELQQCDEFMQYVRPNYDVDGIRCFVYRERTAAN